jgi:hypothetical protein
MPVSLESMDAALFATCDQYLGDTITITPFGSSAISGIRANVAHRDRRADFGISAANVQDAMLDIDKALVPSKPGKGWRVALARIPGRLFEPIDVQRDDSGLRWEFALKDVTNA